MTDLSTAIAAFRRFSQCHNPDDVIDEESGFTAEHAALILARLAETDEMVVVPLLDMRDSVLGEPE